MIGLLAMKIFGMIEGWSLWHKPMTSVACAYDHSCTEVILGPVALGSASGHPECLNFITSELKMSPTTAVDEELADGQARRPWFAAAELTKLEPF